MKRYKKNLEFSYSIGVYPTLELLLNRPQEVERILISSRGSTNKGVQKIEILCREKNIKVETNDRLVESISESQGSYAVGIFRKYESPLQPANHLILANPSDKGNLGTIIRTMLAYDMTDLAVISPAVDIFDPKVIRASMGAIFKLHFAYFDSIESYKSVFKNNLYSFFTDGTSMLHKTVFSEPYSLIFGNEGAGLNEAYKDISESVRIPQSGDVDSLNLSIAVGVALYACDVMKK